MKYLFEMILYKYIYFAMPSIKFFKVRIATLPHSRHIKSRGLTDCHLRDIFEPNFNKISTKKAP